MHAGAFAFWASQFRDVSTSYPVAAGTDYTTAEEVIAGKTGHQIVVLSIVFSVSTDNAATQSFEDNAGTPVPIFSMAASPGVGVTDKSRVFFGERGYVMPDGLSLMHKMSGAGLAGVVAICAYMQPTPSE